MFNNQENLEKTQKIYAVTFGGDAQNYYDAVNRLNNELNALNIFDGIALNYDTTLKNDTEFWLKNGEFINNNRRGYGYWLWKSYVMLQQFNKMKDNDILVYLDCGCEVVNNHDSINRIKLLIEQCNNHNILYTLTGHDDKTYTKNDLFEYMNKNYDLIIDEELKNSMMKQATMIIIKKNDLTNNFINDWYNISCIYNLIDDSPSKTINDRHFYEHRHDQAIFSIILKTNKYKNTMNTPNNVLDPYPFFLSRKRHG